MVRVYFERKGYAVQVATFATEELYLACLQELAKAMNTTEYDLITESVEEE